MSGYACRIGWTDRQAFEVTRVVSERTLEVRRLKATLLNGVNSGQPDALQFSPGGFCGHTSGTQRYSFEPDASNAVIRIRLGKKGWKDAHGNRYSVGDEPREFYDFNF